GGRWNGGEEPLLALLGLTVHVRDLDPVDRAGRDAERERGARIVRVQVHLQRAAVADDEQRVAEPLELALERVRVELLALDHEDGAVAVARELLVDPLEADLLVSGTRRRGKLLAPQRRRDAAHDLD